MKTPADNTLRRCPNAACGKKLWPVAIPRDERFHDLRHTTATLLLKIGTPLGVVQRLLGHSDPTITTEIYGPLEAEDARVHIERLSLSPVAAIAPRGAPVVRKLGRRKNEAPEVLDFSNNLGGFLQSGRQDLNLRPLGPEGTSDAFHALAGTHPSSQPLGTSKDEHADELQTLAPTPSVRTPRTAPVPQPSALPEHMLTVAEVAKVLRVSRATIYKMIKEGTLPVTRAASAIRISPSDIGGSNECRRASSDVLQPGA